MKGKAADGVNGRFTEDDGAWILLGDSRWDGEVAVVFTGSGSHTTPKGRGGSAKFGPHGFSILSKEQEYRVCSVIGVKGAGLNEGLNQFHRNGPLSL